jgi:hypothetical protein
VTWAVRVWRRAPAFVMLALPWLLACENDVAVQLAEPPPPPSAICVDGDPCSGRARALYFHGPYDRVEIASSALLDLPQDFAIEAWLLVESYAGGHGVLNRWIPGVGDIQLTFGTPEPLPPLELPTMEQVPSHVLGSWGFVRPELWITVVAPSLPNVDTWHHVASSYGGGSFRLYVDGSLVGSMNATEPVANPQSTLYFGATARYERAFDVAQGMLYWPPIDGFIAEVRLSSKNRYTADFTPEPRLSVDASTLGLWHLDEGDGSIAADAGPNQLNGIITGASWALAPRRNPPPPSP